MRDTQRHNYTTNNRQHTKVAGTFHTNVHTNRPRQHVRARALAVVRSGVIIITRHSATDGAWQYYYTIQQQQKRLYTQFRCEKMIVVTLRWAQLRERARAFHFVFYMGDHP